MKTGTVKGAADGTLNMLHYDDAAAAGLLAMASPLRGQVYVVSDDQPVTRREICEASLESGLFPDASMPSFAAESGPPAKRTNSASTRSRLGWQPRYRNFQSFMGLKRGDL